MIHILFLILLYVMALLKIPFSLSLNMFKKFLPFASSRINFELKNHDDPLCRSFSISNEKADFCFEVSSEGELEQVMPLLEFFISKNKKIELIFASASVEKKCIMLAKTHSNNIRILRLPIITGTIFNLYFFLNINNWISAPIICFCRYDFYPELLLISKSKKSFLLAASTKKLSWFKRQVYDFFEVIVCSNKKEESFFKDQYANAKVFSFDFRIIRISNRLKLKKETLIKRQTLISYLDFLTQSISRVKLIMGSAWASDLIHLEPQFIKKISSGEIQLLIVPHDLKRASIDEMKIKLRNLFSDLAIYEISDFSEFNSLQFLKNPGVVILNMGGVLCELYSFFNFAYVGGGHETSIHSVLEPFLAGAKVLTSGRVNRSTEYDFIVDNAPQEIYLLKNDQSFYNFFENMILNTDNSFRVDLLVQSQEIFKTITDEFLL